LSAAETAFNFVSTLATASGAVSAVPSTTTYNDARSATMRELREAVTVMTSTEVKEPSTKHATRHPV
jgi:hypothetical protein